MILPKDVSYKDIDYEITDVDEDTGEGTIRYIYDGHKVGSATAEFTDKYLQKVSTRKERVDSKPKDVDNSGDSKENGGKSSAKSRSSMGFRTEKICRKINYRKICDRRRMRSTGDSDLQSDRAAYTP